MHSITRVRADASVGLGGLFVKINGDVMVRYHVDRVFHFI